MSAENQPKKKKPLPAKDNLRSLLRSLEREQPHTYKRLTHTLARQLAADPDITNEKFINLCAYTTRSLSRTLQFERSRHV